MEYTFTLQYLLAGDDQDPDLLVERLRRPAARMP